MAIVAFSSMATVLSVVKINQDTHHSIVAVERELNQNPQLERTVDKKVTPLETASKIPMNSITQPKTANDDATNPASAPTQQQSTTDFKDFLTTINPMMPLAMKSFESLENVLKMMNYLKYASEQLYSGNSAKNAKLILLLKKFFGPLASYYKLEGGGAITSRADEKIKFLTPLHYLFHYARAAHYEASPNTVPITFSPIRLSLCFFSKYCHAKVFDKSEGPKDYNATISNLPQLKGVVTTCCPDS